MQNSQCLPRCRLARMSECIVCGAKFAPTPMHPMVESAWCDACWAVIMERIEIDGDTRTRVLIA
jgi:hypothetical protein